MIPNTGSIHIRLYSSLHIHVQFYISEESAIVLLFSGILSRLISQVFMDCLLTNRDLIE